jgi:hypothetical protein
MVRQGISSAKKRPINLDLDATNWEDSLDTTLEFPTTPHTKSIPSSTSKAKKKNIFGHEKNLNYSPKQSGHFVWKVA